MPELTRSPPSTGDLPGMHLYRATLDAGDTVEIDGVLVTSVARTLLDLARHAPRLTSVAALDFALHESLVDLDALDAVCRACWNWPGIGRAHRALRLVDPRAESPLESLSRLVIWRMPFPPPVTQQRIGDHLGRFVARTDFGWAELGVVGEADGLTKYDRREALTDEKLRQERLEQLGLVVARWGWDEAFHHPKQLERRLQKAFTRAARLKRSGLPPEWSVLAG